MTILEIKSSIGADVVAGVGELIESAVKEWAGCQGATVYADGNIWLDRTQSGCFLTDEETMEFWLWNQAQ